jgi:VanZ family protein
MRAMRLRSILLRWIPSIFIMGIIFLLSSLPASRIPYYGLLDTLIKKGGHALGYGLLGLSYYYALPRSLSRLSRSALALVMSVLFALSDEFHQSFVLGRTSSLVDVAIDGAGAAFALLVGAGYSSNSRSNSHF